MSEYKVGDTVFATNGNAWKRGVVARVTPTGRITLQDGMAFTKFGKQVGGDRWWSWRLVVDTEVQRATYAAYVEKTNRKTLGLKITRVLEQGKIPTVVLNRILAILEAEHDAPEKGIGTSGNPHSQTKTSAKTQKGTEENG